MLTTSAARRLAVQRSMESCDGSWVMSTSLRTTIGPCLMGGLNVEGIRISFRYQTLWNRLALTTTTTMEVEVPDAD